MFGRLLRYEAYIYCTLHTSPSEPTKHPLVDHTSNYPHEMSSFKSSLTPTSVSKISPRTIQRSFEAPSVPLLNDDDLPPKAKLTDLCLDHHKVLQEHRHDADGAMLSLRRSLLQLGWSRVSTAEGTQDVHLWWLSGQPNITTDCTHHIDLQSILVYPRRDEWSSYP